MANKIRVDVVSAESAIYSGNAEMVFVTGSQGELGIAAQHTPLLTTIKPGQVRIQQADGLEHVFYISGGMLEVQPNVITILADTAVRAEDLDEAAALEARQSAEKALAEHKGEIEYSSVLAELAQTAARLRAIRQLKKTTRGTHGA
ncbi:MAG: synthase subunit epsilon [Gammaproteobacteria bacterium]|jgi:F-type H+-transporting ATPase subunit epsilon|nr:synthase subunit epsilon [Gammaproteobacteria bacterium]